VKKKGAGGDLKSADPKQVVGVQVPLRDHVQVRKAVELVNTRDHSGNILAFLAAGSSFAAAHRATAEGGLVHQSRLTMMMSRSWPGFPDCVGRRRIGNQVLLSTGISAEVAGRFGGTLRGNVS
jgi:hypothetical protein